MKKIFQKIICIALSLVSVLVFATACKKEEETSKSEITGKFLSSQTIGECKKDEAGNIIPKNLLSFCNDRTKSPTENQKYLYMTKYYPYNTIGNGEVTLEGGGKQTVLGVHWAHLSYGIEQSLQLKKDFTYRYQYTITIRCIDDWGSPQASLEVDMKGTYSYLPHQDGYLVNLSNPTEGSEVVHGMMYAGGHTGYSRSNTPTYSVDIESIAKHNLPYDEYISGRSVYVWKTQMEDGKWERHLDYDLFDSDIFDKLFCQYSTH